MPDPKSAFTGAQPAPLAFLTRLEAIIDDRLQNPQAGSYVNKLATRGFPRVLQKVGEEATEVVLAGALNSPALVEESADLLFHLMVTLRMKGLSLGDVAAVLEGRDKPKPLGLTADAAKLGV